MLLKFAVAVPFFFKMDFTLLNTENGATGHRNSIVIVSADKESVFNPAL